MSTKLTPRNIWLERQNKPSYIAKDLSSFIPIGIIYEVLLKRGVFKWFSVRRNLIKLKDIWKIRIRESLAAQQKAKVEKKWAQFFYLRGYRAGVNECRQEVRGLCHSQRWQCPDFDTEAKSWLDNYESLPERDDNATIIPVTSGTIGVCYSEN